MSLTAKIKHSNSIAIAANVAGISVSVVNNARLEQPKVIENAEEFVKQGLDEQQLKIFANKYGLLKKECALCLDLGDYRLIPIEAPMVPESELSDALKWAVSENIDMPIDDAVIDYFDVPNAGNVESVRQVNVVVVNKEIIENKVKQYKQAGLKVRIIDIPELAIRNLINAYHLDEEGVVFLYLAKDNGLIVFVRDKQIYFSRGLEFGCEQLKDNKQNQHNLALEMQRSLDYFYRHHSSVGIKRLVLGPTYPNLPDLAPLLDENLSIDSLNFNFNASPPNFKNISDSANALSILSLGAALRIEESR